MENIVLIILRSNKYKYKCKYDCKCNIGERKYN
jgi:hypothetical protein